MATIPIGTDRPLSEIVGRRWAAPLFLALYCGFLFFYGLSAGELYRTENLRAIIAAEFLRSGNWVVPRLYDEPLFTKPPGMYAAIALASWPFGGVTEWTARLPSSLAATAIVFLFCRCFRRHLGRSAGLVAAVILPLSVMWLDKAPAAEIDMLQVAWVAAAILFFLRAVECDERATTGRSAAAPWWFAALLCVAAGVLTKWTAPVFFYATVLPFLWRRGRLHLLVGWPHVASLSVAVAVCVAWGGAAVYCTGWDVFYETVSREALQRLSPAHHLEAQRVLAPHHEHSLYPWQEVLLHPVKLLAMNLPWSAFALLTLRPGFARQWDERGRFLLEAMHCWVWPSMLFWTLIPEHASRHSAPLFPGIAGLAALWWISVLARSPSKGPPCWRFGLVKPANVLVGLIVLGLAAKLIFVEVVIPRRNPNRAPRAKGEQLAAVVPPGAPLYLFHLKDEGIMFYYSRLRQAGDTEPPVRRLRSPAELPSSGGPVYCILDEPEWQGWQPRRPAEVLLHLTDEQGAPVVLVRCP